MPFSGLAEANSLALSLSGNHIGGVFSSPFSTAASSVEASLSTKMASKSARLIMARVRSGGKRGFSGTKAAPL